MVKLVIFDWDGTLADSVTHIIRCKRLAAADCGVQLPDDATLRGVIGLPLSDAINVCLSGYSAADKAAFIEKFRFYMLDPRYHEDLYPDVKEVIADLHQSGYLLGIATNKLREELQKSLLHHDLERYFHATRCAEESNGKPNPAMLRELMTQFNVKPNETLMIGDTNIDLEFAGNAAVPALAVSYGIHSVKDFAGYARVGIIDQFQDIKSYL